MSISLDTAKKGVSKITEVSMRSLQKKNEQIRKIKSDRDAMARELLRLNKEYQTEKSRMVGSSEKAPQDFVDFLKSEINQLTKELVVEEATNLDTEELKELEKYFGVKL